MVNIKIAKRTQSDKVLKDKVYKIASNPNYDKYQRGLASMVQKFFDKNSKCSGAATLASKTALKSTPNQLQLANELHKLVIRRYKRKRVFLSFKDNSWGVDLADVQLITKYNKGIRYLLCAIDIFSKYVCELFLSKTKKVLLLLMHFKVFQIGNQIKHGLFKAENFIIFPSKMVKRESRRKVFNIQ